MAVPLYHVDAFTDRPFAGNPAAVCLLRSWADDGWLRGVAAEMNLSETAFVVPTADGYALRWWTPTTEVALCGHATLAAAHTLWEAGRAAGDVIRFQTRSGILTATRRAGLIELDFPLLPVDAVDAPPGLLPSLGAAAVFVGRSRFDFLVEVESEAAVRALAPDFARLAATVPARGAIVTARSADPRYDFVSRFFAPAAGVAEDPVTGSAHCCLGDFWGRRLGKAELVGFQASARGGVVAVRVSGDRAILGGRAVTVARGELVIGGGP